MPLYISNAYFNRFAMSVPFELPEHLSYNTVYLSTD